MSKEVKTIDTFCFVSMMGIVLKGGWRVAFAVPS